MARSRDRALGVTWTLTAVLVFAGTASAGNESASIDSLILQARQDPDFKVRLSAVLALGRQGDPRAIPALLDALNDKTPSVRTVSLGALAKLVDRRLTPETRTQSIAVVLRLSKEDADTNVRAAATDALAALEFAERAARPREPKGGVFLHVETIESGSTELEPKLVDKLTEAARDELLASDVAFVTEWPGGKLPAKSDLKKAKVRAAFTVMTKVEPIEVNTNGAMGEVQCRLKLVLASYPEKAIRSLVSGGGTLTGQKRPEAIAQAKERCVTDVLRQLMSGQMVAAIRSQAK